MTPFQAEDKRLCLWPYTCRRRGSLKWLWAGGQLARDHGPRCPLRQLDRHGRDFEHLTATKTTAAKNDFW